MSVRLRVVSVSLSCRYRDWYGDGCVISIIKLPLTNYNRRYNYRFIHSRVGKGTAIIARYASKRLLGGRKKEWLSVIFANYPIFLFHYGKNALPLRCFVRQSNDAWSDNPTVLGQAIQRYLVRQSNGAWSGNPAEEEQGRMCQYS